MNKSAEQQAEDLLPFMNKQMGGPYREQWKAGFITGHQSRDMEISGWEDLAKAQEEYITFLGNEISKDYGFLYAHGITTPPDIVNAGIELRATISKAKEALKPYLK